MATPYPDKAAAPARPMNAELPMLVTNKEQPTCSQWHIFVYFEFN